MCIRDSPSSERPAPRVAGDARRLTVASGDERLADVVRIDDAVVRGMLDHRSNAFVESMNGQLQQAKRAARGYRTAKNLSLIHI